MILNFNKYLILLLLFTTQMYAHTEYNFGSYFAEEVYSALIFLLLLGLNIVYYFYRAFVTNEEKIQLHKKQNKILFKLLFVPLGFFIIFALLN